MKITTNPPMRDMAGPAPSVLNPRKRRKDAKIVDVVNIT